MTSCPWHCFLKMDTMMIHKYTDILLNNHEKYEKIKEMITKNE